ncbi:MAG: hypothetical protein P8H13_06985 [Polaribacter sp.]|nr:hypothetical protein [Polaribacter sp.]MDG1811664.1 hypothetical protein [Polaribacter sp.]MDG1993401.1 hypothetical protein [Polaribacter sp.]
MKDIRIITKNNKKIDRKEAIKRIGGYGKYAALTALGTYLILSPQKAQATSPKSPGTGF